MLCELFIQIPGRHVTDTFYLAVIGPDVSIQRAQENMARFILRSRIPEFRLVAEPVNVLELC